MVHQKLEQPNKSLLRLASLYGWLTLEIWFLIALGGGVRAMNAGLACPDWPLCFGDYIPDYHPQVYLEFIHRFMAGAVGLMTAGLTIWVWRTKAAAREIKFLSAAAVVLLIAQIILGALTVLWLLHEKVVAAHLFLATSFFATNLWIYLKLHYATKPKAEIVNEQGDRFGYLLSLALVIAILGQILMGGIVASHSAALVCVEFPLCMGQWVPTLSGAIGLQVMHRLGAYLVFSLGLFQYFYFRKNPTLEVERSSKFFFGLVLLQMVFGISNVLLMTPPLITVAHLATGIALLGFALKILFAQGHYALGVSGWRSGWASWKAFSPKQV